jgi:cytochrome c-type biogenesis protein CcmI
VSALVLGMIVATAVVAWILHPVISGQSAPMGRDDEELTEAQHRKRTALYALRDVEYDYHAGKLDEADYRAMKREVSAEALAALDAEEHEWARREGRKAAPGPNPAADADATLDPVEAEIAQLRASLREGTICRECGHPNRPGSRFCSECGGAFPDARPR